MLRQMGFLYWRGLLGHAEAGSTRRRIEIKDEFREVRELGHAEPRGSTGKGRLDILSGCT